VSTQPREQRRGRLQNGNPPGDYMTAPRCGAKTRKGSACLAPAMRWRKRCRLHGGKSTGPRTAEGRARMLQAVTKHGFYSRELKAARARARAAHRQLAAFLAQLEAN
jgi:hypothetical protein